MTWDAVEDGGSGVEGCGVGGRGRRVECGRLRRRRRRRSHCDGVFSVDLLSNDVVALKLKDEGNGFLAPVTMRVSMNKGTVLLGYCDK